MAAITSNIPAPTIEQFVAGHGESTTCGPNKLILITPGLYTLVPSVCSLLDTVYHGNLFALMINEEVLHHTTDPGQFILDPRIIAAWDWLFSEGRNYLITLLQPIGHYGSDAFIEATEEIGIASERRLPFIGDEMVNLYILPLTQPAPLDETLHNARRAQNHLRCLYLFTSLIRKLTVGKDTILRCPKDAHNWQFYAHFCNADYLPVDILDTQSAFDDDEEMDLEDVKDFAAEQLVRVDQMHEQIHDIKLQYDQLDGHYAILKKRLAEVTSECDVLQTELGRAKGAVSRTLRRLRNAENYITALQEEDFSNFVQVPLPKDYSTSTSSSSATDLSPHTALSSTSASSDFDADMKN